MAADSATARLVERQMRNWELTRAQRPAAPEPPKRAEVEDFICISRMAGLDSSELTAELGQRLRWPVFDKEILEAMAGDDFVRRQLYANMDERDLSWTEEVVRSLLSQELDRNDYFRRLCETLVSLARQGHGIFVGRGADLILPQDRGFRVRLIASLDRRVRSHGRRHRLSDGDARRAIERIERERAEFFRHHFERAADDLSRHDLGLNVDRFTVAEAAELVLAAWQIRRQRQR